MFLLRNRVNSGRNLLMTNSFSRTSFSTVIRWPALVCLLLLLSTHTYGQHKYVPPVKKKPAPPAFPVYSKYKKKDTVAVINPYLQDTLMQPIPMARVGFHDKIDKEQLLIDRIDGEPDTIVTFVRDSSYTEALSKAILNDVDAMQIRIENMPDKGRDAVMDNQQKIGYLRAVWEMLRLYKNDQRPDADYYINLVANLDSMLIAINENRLMKFAIANNNIYTLENGKHLFDTYPEVRAYIYTEVGKADPMMMIRRLEEYSNDTFAGNIIKEVARIDPDLIFKYATSTNPVYKNPVWLTKDPLVQTIVLIASKSKAPLKAFPFLNDIYRGLKTLAEVDTIAAQPDLYFQNLVRLKLEGDSVGKNSYTAELTYRALKYVRQVNELHEEKDDVRFKCLEDMSAAPLYYIMVYGQDEIYTSSFLGTFKRLMERMKPMSGDEFLDSLGYDHFRTFIRMCAGYNTLSDFLGTMSDTSRTELMSDFIAGLQKGNDNELEDAVDVADAFGSIRDSALSAFLEQKVKENYELSYAEKSKKGVIIYSLLSRLFEGNKITYSDTGAAVTSSRLNLPPINKVRYKDLVNDSGIVYQQVFFYGDKDGQDSYISFIDAFKGDKKWKVAAGKYWTTIASAAGKKTIIYANLPLKEPQDEEAQDSLDKFLNDSGIHPSIIVHRGHSYHLPTTLKHLNNGVRIVILGSCGGYHNLALVLDRSPDAHIVSSKQTGARAVNEPILRSMNTSLLQGDDVNWITMWHDLEEYFAKHKDGQSKFTDYVPPYKNLGAIFIKAYRQMMSSKNKGKEEKGN